jgi:hypothetical protein
MTDVTENELLERSKAPRVTAEALQANIVKETFYQHELLTICVLELQNGFTVLGQSACADPSNFMEDVGQRLARKDAEGKIWALMGYELKTKVALVANSNPPTVPNYRTYVRTKVVHAHPLNRRSYNILRGWDLPVDENGDDEGYLVEYADGGQSNVPGFKGYVSWSPKDMFEASYQDLSGSTFKAPTTYLGRMETELNELIEKKQKLRAFIWKTPVEFGDAFLALDSREQKRLKDQYGFMHDYASVLYDRLQFAKTQA